MPTAAIDRISPTREPGRRRPMAERLPAIYNTNSELTVDVTAEGSNRFRFELHAAPDR